MTANRKESLEEKGLRELRAKMSEQERRDMADVIEGELRRREDLKAEKQRNKSEVPNASIAGDLPPHELKDIYASTQAAIKRRKLKEIDEQLAEVQRLKEIQQRRDKSSKRLSIPRIRVESVFQRITSPRVLLAYAIIIVGVLKLLYASGAMTAKDAVAEAKMPEISNTDPNITENTVVDNVIELTDVRQISENEKKLLLALDERRVELQNRKTALERREQELVEQYKIVNEKVIELKSLTEKLENKQHAADKDQEARLEHLATVYGAMAPNEAGPIIAKLDEKIALGLLRRMPGKKMAQVLSVLPQERAVELTRLLTN